MQFQVEAIIGEAREYEHRRSQLIAEDQKRADYLLERISNVRGGICYAILMAVYYTLAFLSMFSVPFALVGVVIGDNNPVNLVVLGVGIFLALLGPAIYFMWYKPRRLEFKHELEADPRLAEVFDAMRFRSP